MLRVSYLLSHFTRHNAATTGLRSGCIRKHGRTALWLALTAMLALGAPAAASTAPLAVCSASGPGAADPPYPSISTITPCSGPLGSTVSIDGTDWLPGSIVIVWLGHSDPPPQKVSPSGSFHIAVTISADCVKPTQLCAIYVDDPQDGPTY